MSTDPLPEHSKWYFGHEVQVIMFAHQPTGGCHVVVYPADCNLVSAVGRDIHLHAGAADPYHALSAVLRDIRTRIASCFRVGDANAAPVLLECEPPCRCLQSTVSLVMVREGSEGEGSPPLENNRNITSGSGNSGSRAQDILPVIQKIQLTLEVMEQRLRHCPVETALHPMDLRAGQTDAAVRRPVQVVTPTADRTRIGESSVVLEDSEHETKPCVPELFLVPQSSASMSASHNSGEVTSQPRMTQSDSSTGKFGKPKTGLDEADEHIRDLIREEIGRVMAGAMGSLAPPAGSGAEI